MADKTSFVNTGSTAGGDGTTNGTVGATRAYVSLAAAELAERRDLTTLAGRMIFNCTGSAADTSNPNFAAVNWPNSTSAFYVQVQANPGQEPVMPYSTTRYRLEPATGTPFANDLPWMRLIGLQAKVSVASGQCFSLNPNNAGVATTMYVERCLANINGQSGSSGFVFSSADATVVFDVSNCVAYTLTGVGPQVGFNNGGNTLNLYNCTAYGMSAGTGIAGATSSTVAKNCLSAGSGTGFSGTFLAGTTSNSSSDATSPGTSPRNTQTFTFTNAGTGDLHITSTDTGAKGFGTNLSADATYPISVDFDAVTRTIPWDIGATVAAAAAAGYPAALFFGIPNRMPQPSVRAY